MTLKNCKVWTKYGAPWTDDHGNPLPYLPTEEYSKNPNFLRPDLYILSPTFVAIPDEGL